MGTGTDRWGWWTPDRENILRTRWASKIISAADIAKELGEGCTRSSVIGKANRLELPSHKRHSCGRKKGVGNKLTRLMFKGIPYKIKRQVKAIVDLAPTPYNYTLLELPEGRCKFSVSLESPHLFCGHPQQRDSSYCEHHHQLCYTPVVARGQNFRRSFNRLPPVFPVRVAA